MDTNKREKLILKNEDLIDQLEAFSKQTKTNFVQRTSTIHRFILYLTK